MNISDTIPSQYYELYDVPKPVRNAVTEYAGSW